MVHAYRFVYGEYAVQWYSIFYSLVASVATVSKIEEEMISPGSCIEVFDAREKELVECQLQVLILEVKELRLTVKRLRNSSNHEREEHVKGHGKCKNESRVAVTTIREEHDRGHGKGKNCLVTEDEIPQYSPAELAPYDWLHSPKELAPMPLPVKQWNQSINGSMVWRSEDSIDWRSVKCMSGVLIIFRVMSPDTRKLQARRYIVNRQGGPFRVDGEASCVECGAQWPKIVGNCVMWAQSLGLVRMSRKNIRCEWCFSWSAQHRTNITVCNWLTRDDIHWKNASSSHRWAIECVWPCEFEKH